MTRNKNETISINRIYIGIDVFSGEDKDCLRIFDINEAEIHPWDLSDATGEARSKAHEDYLALSFGKKVLTILSHPKIEIPERIQVDFSQSLNIAAKSNIEPNLYQLASNQFSKGHKIIDIDYKRDSVFMSHEKANPRMFIAAIAAAIKDNSAALGKNAVLFDVKALEQIPEISKHMQQFSQRHR